jgi:transposase InsO family protein
MSTRQASPEDVADFRYRLVAELANPYLGAAERRQLIREKARVEHEVPAMGRRRLSESYLRKWLAIYLKRGKEGLRPRDRRDAGRCRVLSANDAALLLSTLENKPTLTASAVLRQLQQQGKISSCPSKSSLSRLVRSAGLERARRLHQAEVEKNLKFDFFAPLECVQVDGMYTVSLADERGNRRQAVLLSFLDDATRRVLYASFAFSESSLAFEAGIRHILAAHGRIGKIFCDNGSAFVSSQTQRILDTLGLVLVHSRVGRPAGRGKIERMHRTFRDQFFRPLDPQSIKSLPDLEMRFHSWLESEYHRSPHRGLGGKTPLEAWLEKAHYIIPMDPTVNLEEIFLHQAPRKVHKDSTVTIDGTLFEVPSDLIGERITLYYDPHLSPERRRPLIVHKSQRLGEARRVDSYANAHVRRGGLQKEVEVTKESPEAAATLRRPVDASLAASRIITAEQEHME